MLDNTLFDTHMSVAAKIAGFEEASGVADFQVLKRTSSSVYFEYRDQPSNLHRYNYFEWFAVPGDPYATLQVSVAGRRRDVPGLKALLNRFADNVTGTRAPRRPPSSSPGPTDTSSPTASPRDPLEHPVVRVHRLRRVRPGRASARWRGPAGRSRRPRCVPGPRAGSRR